MPLKSKKTSSSSTSTSAGSSAAKKNATKTSAGTKKAPSKAVKKSGTKKAPGQASGGKTNYSAVWPPGAESCAIAIQSVFRGFRARRDYQKVISEKKVYDEEMSKLRQEAWIFQVALERKEEAKRRKAAEAERNRKAAESKLRKDMLEAAFDGELEELKNLVDQGGDPECSDNHGNTCLSEAAAGGDKATVEYLLNTVRVDPNSRGEFGRTPLWRACFMGKTDIIPLLLAAGSDPRIPNEAGETCEMTATSEAGTMLEDTRLVHFSTCTTPLASCSRARPARLPQITRK